MSASESVAGSDVPMKFCVECGKQIRARAEICPHCGVRQPIGAGEMRRLYRDTRAGKLGGVCAGLAEYFAIDVTIVRVLFVLAALLGGSGIIAYIVLWIVVPEKPAAPGEPSMAAAQQR